MLPRRVGVDMRVGRGGLWAQGWLGHWPSFLPDEQDGGREQAGTLSSARSQSLGLPALSGTSPLAFKGSAVRLRDMHPWAQDLLGDRVHAGLTSVP